MVHFALMSQWYLCDLLPTIKGRPYYFRTQVYAASADHAVKVIEARYPASWCDPSFSVAPILEPLSEEQSGWQGMAPAELDCAGI